MSRENVEIVRSYFQGTADPLEGESLGTPAKEHFSALVPDFWEADGDWYPIRKFPEVRPCHGRDEIVALLGEIRAAWDAYRYVVKDARAIGDERVLVRGRMWTEGRASGVRLEGDIYHCCCCGMDD